MVRGSNPIGLVQAPQWWDKIHLPDRSNIVSGQIYIIAEGMCQEKAEGMGCMQCDVANNEDADGSALAGEPKFSSL